MAASSGADYLAGPGTSREIWLDGERVEDVTSYPRHCGAAHSIAELYDLQLRDDVVEEMTYRSPSSGDRVASPSSSPARRPTSPADGRC